MEEAPGVGVQCSVRWASGLELRVRVRGTGRRRPSARVARRRREARFASASLPPRRSNVPSASRLAPRSPLLEPALALGIARWGQSLAPPRSARLGSAMRAREETRTASTRRTPSPAITISHSHSHFQRKSKSPIPDWQYPLAARATSRRALASESAFQHLLHPNPQRTRHVHCACAHVCTRRWRRGTCTCTSSEAALRRAWMTADRSKRLHSRGRRCFSRTRLTRLTHLTSFTHSVTHSLTHLFHSLH